MPYADPEVAKAYHKRYRIDNRDKINAYGRANSHKYKESRLNTQRKLRITSKNYRVSCSLRSRLGNALRSQSVPKYSSLFKDLIGCSKDELIKHLESLFKDGMVWENYGRTGWHIDHIVPLSSFDLSNPEELATAAHYKNLQPLWARENIIKGNKKENDK